MYTWINPKQWNQCCGTPLWSILYSGAIAIIIYIPLTPQLDIIIALVGIVVAPGQDFLLAFGKRERLCGAQQHEVRFAMPTRNILEASKI